MSTATTHIKTDKQLVPALRYKEFEGEWGKKKMGDLSERIGDGLHGTPKYVDESDIHFVNGNNLINGNIFITDKTKKVDKNTFLKNDKNLADNTVLISLNGTIGNIARYNNEKVMLGKSVGYFNFNTDSEYYYHILKSPKIQRFFISELTGSTIKNLSLKTLRETIIPFPTLPEQQKIASFLSAVDEKIQQLTKKKELLEQYKKGVMQQLFSGQLRFKDEEGKDYPDWEEKRLSELVLNHNSGIYKDKKLYGDGTNIIGVSNLYSIDFIDGQEFKRVKLDDDELEKYSLNEGDLIYGESSLVRSGIAKTLSVTKKGKGTCFAWHTRRYSIDQSIIQATFLYYQINAPICRRFIESVATQTALTGITTKEYFKTPISIPSLSEQQKIATYLSSIDTKIEAVNNQITQTQTFKKGLLQQMFV